MADPGASVLARLRNKAQQTGRSNQLCMQLFCQEEFLRRLEASDYAGNFVLKGGLFLYTLTEYDSRVTLDVDFLLQRIPNTPEKLLEILSQIITADTGNDFITFEIRNIQPISLHKQYPGIHADLIAHIKNTRTPFGIDLGIGDVIVPGAQKRPILTQLDGFPPPVVQTYSIETTVAEKLDAILSLMDFSTRMKDYYDICYLAEHFDFSGSTLHEALQKTFANRHREFSVPQFAQMLSFASDEMMQRKWTAFCKKIHSAEPFSAALKTIDAFLSQPFQAAVQDGEFDLNWSAEQQIWS